MPPADDDEPAGGTAAPIEMNTIRLKEDSFAHGSSYSTREPNYDETPPSTFAQRFRDSFKRDPKRRITPPTPKAAADARLEDGRHYDIKQATLRTADSALARKLKGRHLQMIAIGGSIGTCSPHPPMSRDGRERLRFRSARPPGDRASM
jgi:amino acid transporter